MTPDSPLSTRAVPFRHVVGVLALTGGALVLFAVTPLADVLTTAAAAVVLRALALGWLALALVADVTGWGSYSRSRQRVAVAVWVVLGAATLSRALAG